MEGGGTQEETQRRMKKSDVRGGQVLAINVHSAASKHMLCLSLVIRQDTMAPLAFISQYQPRSLHLSVSPLASYRERGDSVFWPEWCAPLGEEHKDTRILLIPRVVFSTEVFPSGS